MKKLCPSAVADRFKSMGEQQRGYRLPSLAVARQEFERAVGVQIGWGEPVAITSPELTAFEIGAMYETFHLEVAMPWPG
jgi:hypothetical protein